jgi:hypothetical protein
MSSLHDFELVTPGMDEFFGEIRGIRGDERNAIHDVDGRKIVRRVHALVEDDSNFLLSTPQHGLADVIKDGPEQLGVVPIAFVFAVKKRQPGLPVHQQRQTDLPEPVLSLLVLAALGQFRIGVTGHERKVVGGIEQEACTNFRGHFFQYLLAPPLRGRAFD